MVIGILRCKRNLKSARLQGISIATGANRPAVVVRLRYNTVAGACQGIALAQTDTHSYDVWRIWHDENGGCSTVRVDMGRLRENTSRRSTHSQEDQTPALENKIARKSDCHKQFFLLLSESFRALGFEFARCLDLENRLDWQLVT